MTHLLALLALAAPHLDQYGDPLPDGAIARFGTMRYRIGTERNVRSWALSPLGKTLAVEDRFGIGLWDIETGRCTHPYSRNFATDEHGQFGLCYSLDGKYLARLSGTNVSVINANTGVWRFAVNLKELGKGGRSIAFVPDQPNRLVVTSAEESKAFFIDATLGSVVSTLQAKDAMYWLSPKGNFFFGRWGVIPHLIDAKTGEVRCRFFDLAQVDTDCVLSSDEKWLYASDSYGTFFKCDAETGAVVEKREGLGNPQSKRERSWISLSTDGNIAYIATASVSGTIRRDIKSGLRLATLPTPAGGPLLSLPDCRRVLHLADDGRLRIYDLGSLKNISSIEGFLSTPSTASSPDARRVAVASGGNPCRHELFDATGNLLRSILASSGASHPHWSSDGTVVAFASEKTITLRDASTWKTLHVLGVPGATAESEFESRVFFVPKGDRLIASLGNRGKLVLFDWKTGRHLKSIETNSLHAKDLSPDGKMLILRSWDDGPALFDLTSEALMTGGFMDKQDSPGSIRSLAFSRDGAFLFAWNELEQLRSSRTVIPDFVRAEIRHPRTGRLMRSFPMGQGAVSKFALSDNGLWLAARDVDDDFHLWDIERGKELGKWSGHRGRINDLHFAGIGRVLTNSDDHTALLWELRPKEKPGKPLWDALAGNDAVESYRAVWAIAEDPKGPELLRSKIKPLQSAPTAKVKQLLTDLGADRYAVRETATQNLHDLGRLIEPDLRATFERTKSEEVRARSKGLLAKIAPERTPQEYLHARAVAAMEIAGTADAHKLLAEWATGAVGARLTIDAKAALGRMAVR